MSAGLLEANPKRQKLALEMAAKYGRPHLAESLRIGSEELDNLLDGNASWTPETNELLTLFVDLMERRAAGEAGVGSGETVYEVSNRGMREAADLLAQARSASGDGAAAFPRETESVRLAPDEGALSWDLDPVVEADWDSDGADPDQWRLPDPPAEQQPEAEVDPALLVKAARVADLFALIEAGRQRACDWDLTDRDWRELAEALLCLELVMIVDYGANPDDPGENWDAWRCRREEQSRWRGLREVRRAMAAAWPVRLWRWATVRRREGWWLDVLMDDVDRGRSDGLRPGVADAALRLGISGTLERRWERQGLRLGKGG